MVPPCSYESNDAEKRTRAAAVSCKVSPDRRDMAISVRKASPSPVSRPLRMALRIGRLQEARDDLESAMRSRMVIDIAIGVVMTQNRCRPDEAFTLLRKASNARNTKLREVGGSIVAAIAGTTDLRSRFDL
ncbi:ANTAR domain-containing protein [Arthrobacter sp. NPDC058130]|uniref:ANTAR domain-containing protein n=1 Tax=Arthrobacter sp. NPDC058130 TaxID=3346353 RepID=UPI0036EA4B82